MKKIIALKQKQIGITLVALGVFLCLFIFLFLYLNVVKIAGFPELLPADKTMALLEFPLQLDEKISGFINKNWGIGLEKNIFSWAGEKGAVAFLKSDEDRLLPFLLLHVRSVEKGFAYLKTYKNDKNEINEKRANNVVFFETPAISFAFLSDILVVSPSVKGLEQLLYHQNALSERLGADKPFIKIRQNLTSQYFLYIKPREMPRQAYQFVLKFIPRAPLLTFSFPALGIAASKNGNSWEGHSYAIFDNDIVLEPEQPYKAGLLSAIPPDADFLLSGQNLQSQLKKLEALTAANDAIPKIKTIASLLTREYFPDADFEKDVLPLLSKEFIFTANGEKILFVTELADPALEKTAEKLRLAFQKISARFAPSLREVRLPGGEKANEFIPDAGQIKIFSETFNGIAIKGLIFKKKNGVYDALAQNKWFISNDLSTLKKVLLLTREPGLQFRDSSIYKQYLQPILKNPELLGVTALPFGTFSFSKRTFSDHMETQFVITIK